MSEGGWKAMPLGELCTVFTDGDWVETKDQSSDGIRLIQTGNVGCGEFKNRSDKARFVDEETFHRLNCQEVLPGDCLVSRLPDPVGRACLVPDLGARMITAVDCTIIRFDNTAVQSDFFRYYAQSRQYLSDVESWCTGATRKRISRKNLGKVQVPQPPVSEQQRIVTILDEAFAGIDAVAANAEKNLANARELFEGCLDAAFGGAADGWVTQRINSIADISYGYTQSAAQEPVGPRFLRITDIQDGRVEWSTVPFCKISEQDYEKYQLKDGDIVFARTGATTGKSYLVVNPPQAVCASYLIRLRTSAEHVTPALLSYFFQTGEYWRTIRAGMVGSAQGGFNATKLGELEIRYPRLLAEQNTMVDRLDRIANECRNIEVSYDRKRASFAELKQSILQKAFSGELTAKEAEKEMAAA